MRILRKYPYALSDKIVEFLRRSQEPVSLEELLENFTGEKTSEVYAVVRSITERGLFKFNKDMKLVSVE